MVVFFFFPQIVIDGWSSSMLMPRLNGFLEPIFNGPECGGCIPAYIRMIPGCLNSLYSPDLPFNGHVNRVKDCDWCGNLRPRSMHSRAFLLYATRRVTLCNVRFEFISKALIESALDTVDFLFTYKIYFGCDFNFSGNKKRVPTTYFENVQHARNT